MPGMLGMPEDDDGELELDELGMDGDGGMGIGVIGAHAARVISNPAAAGRQISLMNSRTRLIIGMVHLPSDSPFTRAAPKLGRPS